MYVQMKIAGIGLDPESKGPVVLLRDVESRFTLPIWIGLLEASAIAYALEGVDPPRPLTHDLMKVLVEELGGRVTRVDVDSLEDNVFRAKIHLAMPGGAQRLIDSRPSDALALALRTGAEIYAEEGVLEKASTVAVREAPEPPGEDAGEDAWKEFLEGLDPDAFGKYKM